MKYTALDSNLVNFKQIFSCYKGMILCVNLISETIHNEIFREAFALPGTSNIETVSAKFSAVLKLLLAASSKLAAKQPEMDFVRNPRVTD